MVRGIHAIRQTLDDAVVKGVLEVTLLPEVPQPRRIRFVFGVKHLGVAVEIQSTYAQAARLDRDCAMLSGLDFRLL